MSLRIGPGRVDVPRSRRGRWLVVTMLVALAFSLLTGTSFAQQPIPSDSGPEGIPALPPAASPRIVGGAAVPDGKYPFQAALLLQSNGNDDYQRQFCGGSLIAPSQVLTAAHCVDFFGAGPDPMPVSELRVVVGRTVLTSNQGQRRSVQKIAIHPRWSRTTFSYDAAVITLAQPIVGIRPILVTPGLAALERPGKPVTISGWGNTLAQPIGSDAGSSFPDRMREVAVPIVSPTTCDAALTFDGVHLLDRQTMLCAGRAGRDTCHGDSGGPLFTRALAGRYVQVGITSWGVGCAAAGYPGVYTKLSNRSIGSFILTAATSSS